MHEIHDGIHCCLPCVCCFLLPKVSLLCFIIGCSWKPVPRAFLDQQPTAVATKYERSLFFKYTVIPDLRVFWGAPNFLGAYHVSCSLSLAFSRVDSFIAGASKTQEFWGFRQGFIIKIDVCKENRG